MAKTLKDVMVPTRSGNHICLDVFLPDGDGPFPAVYAQSPYLKDAVAVLPHHNMYRKVETGPIDFYTDNGYAYVLADAPGSGKSEGDWALWDKNEQDAMCDVIDWIAEQDWCTRKVGMIGESYFAISQWLAAVNRPRNLACIAPFDGLTDPIRDAFYHGGVPCRFVAPWMHEIRNANNLDYGFNPINFDPLALIQDENLYPDAWKERSTFWRIDQIEVPVFSIGNWAMAGMHLRGNLSAFKSLKSPKKLLVMDGHNMHTPQVIFGSVEFHQTFLLPWYDHWLKGIDSGVMDGPPVQLFVPGTGEYRQEDDWPLARAENKRLYLSGGRANALESLNDGALVWDEDLIEEGSVDLEYPRADWAGGPIVFGPSGVPNTTAGVMTFTTGILEEDIEITGPMKLVLYASSDQLDTDFILRLSEQMPPPPPLAPIMSTFEPPFNIVSKGWLKASRRKIDRDLSTETELHYTLDEKEMLEPGRIYKFEIEFVPACRVFKAGNRIRLELKNADSPTTELLLAHINTFRAGADTYYYEGEHKSHLVLPVVSS